MNNTNKSQYDDRNVSQNASQIINANELAGIEEMDPSLADGFKVVYDREIPLELRLQDEANSGQEVGTLETIRIRVLIQGETQNPQILKIEFTSESDLFFHYGSIIDEATFQRMRDEQKLNVEFGGLLNLAIKMFNSCQKDTQNFFGVFFMQKNGQAKLDFIQNMEYKFLQLLSIDCQGSSEDIIRANISFRYSVLKAKSSILTNRLKDVSQVLKVKNPTLLVQLQKGMTGTGQKH